MTAKFQCVHEATNNFEYVLDNTNVIGVVKASMLGKAKPPKEGTIQQCVVLWVDYSNNVVFLSNKTGDLEHITADKEISQNLVGKTGLAAKVLFKNETIFACSLKKGKNPIVFCPIQLHFNDFERAASKAVEEGQFCKLAFIHGSQCIAVLDDIRKLYQEINRKRKIDKDEKHDVVEETKKQKLEKSKDKQEEKFENPEHQIAVNLKKSNELSNNPKTKKQKLEKSKEKQEEKFENPDHKIANEISNNPKIKERKRTLSETGKVTKKSKTTPQKEEKNSDNESSSDEVENKVDSILFYEDKAPDKKAAAKVVEITPVGKVTDKKSQKTAIKSLTGVNDFWNLDLTNISKTVESSDEDEDDETKDEKTNAKKKLTTAEKFKQQREEEARLRAIEEKYADPNQLPDSVDQYDRLVLSDPNNSKHWINYMVFHLQSTEIDKARAVARRALKTINFRNSDEQINIWVALLNLELRYGNKESFNDILKEALMYNEPLKIYLRTVEIITDAQKSAELIEIIGNITKKFKTEPEVWHVSANAFFTIGMTERAQQLLHKALACLPDRDRK